MSGFTKSELNARRSSTHDWCPLEFFVISIRCTHDFFLQLYKLTVEYSTLYPIPDVCPYPSSKRKLFLTVQLLNEIILFLAQQVFDVGNL